MESKPPIINTGPKRTRAKLIQALAAVAVAFVAYKLYRGVFGASGTAKNVRELAPVYRDAGRAFPSFYTNTFLQEMPFTNPIRWRREGGRPAVILTSRVDVAEFKRRMVRQPFESLWESGFYGGNVVSFKLPYRFSNSVILSFGTLDISSGAFSMQSLESDYLVDDHEWQRYTNRLFIKFDWEGTN